MVEPMEKHDVAIVGTGVAGITAARLLQDEFDVVLIEKGPIGGKTASVEVDGSWFDYAGHLLHSIDALPEEIRFNLNLDNWGTFQKRGWSVLSDGTMLSGLVQKYFPHEVEEVDQSSLASYYVSKFGPEASRKFFIPYNQKVYGPLRKIVPTKAESQRSPKIGQKQYNETFMYPKRGGDSVLDR